MKSRSAAVRCRGLDLATAVWKISLLARSENSWLSSADSDLQNKYPPPNSGCDRLGAFGRYADNGPYFLPENRCDHHC